MANISCAMWRRLSQNSVKLFRIKKVKRVPVFPPSYQFTEPHALPISALEGRGLDELKKAVEEEIVNSTGKHILDLQVDLGTPQLRWKPFIFPLCVFFFFFCNVQNNKSIHSKCASSPTAGCTRKQLFGTCRWMQMKARLSSRSSSAPPLTDATRNCSLTDSRERRRGILHAARPKSVLKYWKYDSVKEWCTFLWINKLQKTLHAFVFHQNIFFSVRNESEVEINGQKNRKEKVRYTVGSLRSVTVREKSQLSNVFFFFFIQLRSFVGVFGSERWPASRVGADPQSLLRWCWGCWGPTRAAAPPATSSNTPSY